MIEYVGLYAVYKLKEKCIKNKSNCFAQRETHYSRTFTVFQP